MKRILFDLMRPVVAATLIVLLASVAWTLVGRAAHKELNTVVLQVHGDEFKFVPDVLTVTKGDSVTIVFTNDGVLAHNFSIDELDLKTDTIQSDETADLHFVANKAGSFKFDCLVPGHMDAGMMGKLVVSMP